MHSVAEEFKQFITPYKFEFIHTPVIANATVEPYAMENIKDNLVQQITSPVRWSETISYLKKTGENEFIEIGPNNALTRLMTKN